MMLYEDFVEIFTKLGYRVILFDLYGLGGSDSPDITFNIGLYTSQLNELLIYLQNEIKSDKIILGGTSMGGGIVSHYASLFHHKISKLILMAPFGVKVIIPFYQKPLFIPGVKTIIEFLGIYFIKIAIKFVYILYSIY